MLPEADQYLEDIYKLCWRQGDEKTRCEVARIALLAAQYRANQLQQPRKARAIARRKAARAELKAQTGQRARAHSQAQSRMSPGDEPGNLERETP